MCDDDARAASEWSLQLIDEGPGIVPVEDFRAVKHDAPGRDFEDWPVVVVRPGRAELSGRQVALGSELKTTMTAKRKLYEQLDPKAPPLWAYWIADARAPVRDVTESLASLERAGLAGVIIVREARATLSPPPKATLDRELKRYGSSSSLMDPRFSGSPFSECPAARELGGHGSTPTLRALAEALPKCGCSPSDAEARSVFWFLMGRTVAKPGTFTRMRLTTAGGTPDRTVTLAGATWQETHAAVISAAESGDSVRVTAP